MTTAEAVTEVTARTPCVGARDTRSDVAGEPTARGWVWTTWAGVEPPEVWKGKMRTHQVTAIWVERAPNSQPKGVSGHILEVLKGSVL